MLITGTLQVESGLITPGHFTINGTRIPPS